MSKTVGGKRNTKTLTLVLAAMALVLAIAAIGATFAWLYIERQVAAVGLVDSPMSIYINAAHKEDIQYLDLSDIDMTRQTDGGVRYNYQDFVFSVQGEDLLTFKLQLAYTTNNQFTFEIFEAQEVNSGGVVDYYSEETGSTIHYDMIGSALTLTYMTLKAGNGNKLGDPANQYNIDTYLAGGSKYGYVDQYAEPIYCQTAAPINVRNRQGTKFHNYFILRVHWDNSKLNDRETDLIYIAARAGD